MKSFKQYLIPSIVASILMSAYGIIDGIFIGFRLNDSGLAAINLAWPITAFVQGLGFAFGISGGIYLSRLLGLDRKEELPRVRGTILVFLGIVSIVVGSILYVFKKDILILFHASGDTLDMAVEYISIILYGSLFQMLGSAMIPLLKNIGKIKLAMVASITATISNLILDYFMIFEWNMGLKGAAIASVLAQGIAFSISIIPYVVQVKGIVVNKECIRELFLGTLAPFILNYSYSILIILTNVICEDLGSDAAVAAYTVLSYMLWVVNAAASGTADAIQPLFSYHSSKMDWKKNRKYLIKCLVISFGIISIFSIVFYFLRNPICYLYGLSMDAKDVFIGALGFYLVGFLFISIHKVVCSYMYSINEKVKANIFVLLEPLVLTPICYILFVNLSGITGLWLSFMLVQVIMVVVAIGLGYLTEKKHERTINC